MTVTMPSNFILAQNYCGRLFLENAKQHISCESNNKEVFVNAVTGYSFLPIAVELCMFQNLSLIGDRFV